MLATMTEKAVLFIGANRPIVGREEQAMTLWSEMKGWIESQQNGGWFTRYDGMWLTPHGGDLNSAFFFYGERAKLDEWRRTDEFEQFVFRITNILTQVRVIPGVTFAATAETLERRNKALATK
jgi:hypothetical protein